MRRKRQTGIALITTVLVLMLMSALLVGFTMMVMSDTRLGTRERDRTQALYGAHAGQEKMTSDLGTLFSANAAPTTAMVNSLQGPAAAPVLPGITYAIPGGGAGTGYSIQFPIDPVTGNPAATNRTILSGAFQGMTGLITPYTMTVTARTATGSEVRLRRQVQTVGIPVFQFGIFSETDLSFFAGPNFNFGGRTHTNSNLYLAQGDGTTLTLGDRVTAIGEAIRTNLSNGWDTSNSYNGTVNVIRAPGVFRALARTEGSLVATIPSAQNEPTWTNLSIGTYNGNIRNGRTGANRLNLPLVSLGAQPIDLIRRAPVNENVTNPGVYSQRFYTSNPGDQITSLRILLSDTPNDLLTLPEATATVPIYLGNLALFPQAGYVPGNAASGAGGGTLTPFATCDTAAGGDCVAIGAQTANQQPLIGGYIKIEMRTAGGVWQDVTAEILRFGVAGRNISAANALWNSAPAPGAALPCPEPNPNAIIRFQRFRDIPASNGPCGNGATGVLAPGSMAPSNISASYWPMALYDPREGYPRDPSAGNGLPNNAVYPGGVMQYIELDVRNLGRWLTGALPGSGVNALNVNGWVVYFSDRRGNRNAVGAETGEYGQEDFVNPASAPGAPNGVLDTGEDVNGNGTFEVYGQTPRYPGIGGGVLAPAPNGVANPQFSVPLDSTVRPWSPFGAATVDGTAAIAAPAAGAARAANVVTITTTAAHGFSVGQWVNVSGVANATFNGAWQITAVPSATTFRYNQVGVNTTSGGGNANVAHPMRANQQVFFRRALKLVNGGLGNVPVPGLTIASENPVYIQGDYNASTGAGGAANFGNPHSATSVIADSVTLLSSAWNDIWSFRYPGTPIQANPGPGGGLEGRKAASTTYRLAIISGKGLSFPQPAGTPKDFGTDGGVHNFLRYIEDWGGQTLNYRGSIVSFYFNRQAVGTYKCCTVVYSPPSRGYNFDTDFLTPTLLPPRTPMFRDVNTIGFTQIVNPTQP